MQFPQTRRLVNAGIVSLMAAVVLGAPSPALAVISPGAACGSGYSVVSDGTRSVKTPGGTVYGNVYLLYNNSNGKNCVVTIKTSFVGTSTWVSAHLAIQGTSGWYTEEGNFKYYAGGPPANLTVKFAAGKCVAYYGYIRSGTNNTGTLASGGRLTFGNCG